MSARWSLIHPGALALLLALAGPLRAEEPATQPVRVYFIGNSVTDTIHYEALARLAAQRGIEQVWGRQMIPGAPLSWLWEHPDQGFTQEPFGPYPKALGQYTWDILSLQPFDRLLEGGDDSDLTVARRFIDLARQRSPDLRVYIYQRWPRRDEPEKEVYRLDYAAKWLRPYSGGWDGTNETRDYFDRLVRALRAAYPDLREPVRLVPVGDVLLALDRHMKAGEVPGFAEVSALYADGIHFNDTGRAVVGCTFFATLYRQSPVGLSLKAYGIEDEALARAIQETVWNVVRAHPLAGVVQPPAETP